MRLRQALLNISPHYTIKIKFDVYNSRVYTYNDKANVDLAWLNYVVINQDLSNENDN